MAGNNTIVINGKVYDAITGLPSAAPTPTVVKKPLVTAVTSPASLVKSLDIRPSAPARATHHAASAHVTPQKSTTLRRDVLKKPVAKAQVGTARRKPDASHISKSDTITRFAPHPQPLQSARSLDVARPKAPTVAPVLHPIVASKQALTARPAVQPAAQPALSTRSVKEQLISERLAAVDLSAKPEKKPKRSLLARQPRAFTVVTASLAIMIFGGYLTYLNMPGLSVRVAAAQADVAASFPDYHPDGYRFDGPVSYQPGQVAINFLANGGTTKYTITEQKSTWDSQAVYDNIISRTDDNNYVTNSQQGLTIYTYGGKAAWVNKGILYTVQGDAPLSNEQLLKIASSL